VGTSATTGVVCNKLLQSPFFFSREEWLPVSDWRREIVRGKGYTTDDEVGRRLWSGIELRLRAQPALLSEASMAIESRRYGQPQTVLIRLGQGAFRVIGVDIYKRQCAGTNFHVLHVLDAAHISPYEQWGTHSPSNGLLLRQDIHTLFDRGYLSVTIDYHGEVSRRLKGEFDKGKEYYSLQCRNIVLPESRPFRPSQKQLAWPHESDSEPPRTGTSPVARID
jgi:putative restriction endonuclease